MALSPYTFFFFLMQTHRSDATRQSSPVLLQEEQKQLLPFIGYQVQVYPGDISSNYFKALAGQL